MKGYDEYNTVLLPPRQPMEKLPVELLDYYDGTLSFDSFINSCQKYVFLPHFLSPIFYVRLIPSTKPSACLFLFPF